MSQNKFVSLASSFFDVQQFHMKPYDFRSGRVVGLSFLVRVESF